MLSGTTDSFWARARQVGDPAPLPVVHWWTLGKDARYRTACHEAQADGTGPRRQRRRLRPAQAHNLCPGCDESWDLDVPVMKPAPEFDAFRFPGSNTYHFLTIACPYANNGSREPEKGASSIFTALGFHACAWCQQGKENDQHANPATNDQPAHDRQ